jgi:hypothetical protein
MNGNNPYWPYWVSNTLNFTYNGKNVWGTILKFGKDYITCITKDGYRSYKWNKMSPPCLYQCGVSDLIVEYERSNNMDFEYLYKYYGPSRPTVQWKED